MWSRSVEWGINLKFKRERAEVKEKRSPKERWESFWEPVFAPACPDDDSSLTRDGVTRSVYSLRYTIWRYFMVFIVVILLLLWLMQATFLQTTYKDIRERYLRQTADTILSSLTLPNYWESLNRIAYTTGVCIEIVGLANNSLYTSPEMLPGECSIHGVEEYELLKEREQVLLDNLLKEGRNTGLWQGTTSQGNPYLLLGVVLSSEMTNGSPYAFLFINALGMLPLSVEDALREILTYITLFLLGVGLLVSFYMARSIARPIVNITKSAELMAQGNFNVTFDGGGFNEAEQLANTLNYASSEVSKVDTLRRDLMANISHDLRTPLTMVKAYAEMIRDLSGENPEKRNQHIQVIIQESDRLSALVNDILDLSKLESGNQPLECGNFNLTSKLREVLTRYTVLSEQKGYRFTLEAEQELEVCGDVRKLEQVIYNLINNAVNYSGESKEITIRQSLRSPKWARVEIIDRGPGIASEQLPLIFDRYYRTGKAQREIIGTGLGLSIVKNILKQHNFPFGVQSKEGLGSTFWFECAIAVTAAAIETSLPGEKDSKNKDKEKDK